MAQNQIKHIRVAHPLAGVNQFACAYGTRRPCGGLLDVPIDLDMYAIIKTYGARTFTPICPACKRRSVVHIG